MSRTPSTSAIDFWFTSSEWGTDRRTGTAARLTERERRPGDRPGKNGFVWDWLVYERGGLTLARGVAQNQKGARRAVREFIRTLPDKET